MIVIGLRGEGSRRELCDQHDVKISHVGARRAPNDEITERIKDRIREVLPDPVPVTAEAVTGSFAAIPDRVPDQYTDRR